MLVEHNLLITFIYLENIELVCFTLVYIDPTLGSLNIILQLETGKMNVLLLVKLYQVLISTKGESISSFYFVIVKGNFR